MKLITHLAKGKLERRRGRGSRLAKRPRSGLALTPWNDQTLKAGGWGCSSPGRLPRGERPRRAAGGASKKNGKRVLVTRFVVITRYWQFKG